MGSLLSRQTVDVDARKYIRLGDQRRARLPLPRLKSWGDFPGYLYFGGNSELRGYEYLEFIGNKAFFANAELRFPLIEAALTPIGVVGGLRGVFFVNFGASGFRAQAMTVCDAKSDHGQRRCSATRSDPTSPSRRAPVFGPPRTITGLRLVDGRASYGFGLETFALGFPIHFDWSWRTLFNKGWEDYVFSYQAHVTEGRPAANGCASRSSASGSATISRTLELPASSFQLETLGVLAVCRRLDAASSGPARHARAGSWSWELSHERRYSGAETALHDSSGSWRTTSSISCRRTSTRSSNGTCAVPALRRAAADLRIHGLSAPLDREEEICRRSCG